MESLSKHRRPDPRRTQIGGPNVISRVSQVSSYSGEPKHSILSCNLLSKDNWKAAHLYESEKYGPKVSRIIFSQSKTGLAEGLAGAASGADRLVVRPTNNSKGERPTADSGKEVMLGESNELVGFYVGYASLVNNAISNVAMLN